MARVLMPLPSTDFDPTESAVPWHVLTAAGHEVVFATPEGKPARADERVLTGRGFGPWRPFMRANAVARACYARMEQAPGFRSPIAWAQLASLEPDALVLPGGHAPGMREYLESTALQSLVARVISAGRPVGAICHGVLVAARARSGERSALHGRRCTALPRHMEMLAWWLTRWWLGRYYRTYDESVEDEVSRLLGPEGRFERGPRSIRRDRPGRLDLGFVVEDGPLVTARWPGDAHRFAQAVCARL